MERQALVTAIDNDASTVRMRTTATTSGRRLRVLDRRQIAFSMRTRSLAGASAKTMAVFVALLIGTGGLWLGVQSGRAASEDVASLKTMAKEEGSVVTSTGVISPDAAGVRVEWTSVPATPEPDQPVTLSYRVVDAGSRRAITDLPNNHERPMHLIIVNRDLTQFQHIHPALTADGSYQVETTLPVGAYVLYDEFMHKEQTVLDQRELTVGDPPATKARLTPDLSPKAATGLTVALDTPMSIEAGESASFTFEVTRNGQPVTDLAPYLGAAAHVAIVAGDGAGFAHTHGEAAAAGTDHTGDHQSDGHSAGGQHHGPPAAFGPHVAVEHTFPAAGHYKLWAQFQHSGQVITVPFVVAVD